LVADGKLEAAKREAQAQVKLAEASSEAISLISKSISNDQTSALFLLGDRYIDTLKKMSESPNSKFVVYPADLQSAIRGLFNNKL